MTVERDDYGNFHVRGTYDDGEPGWGIQVWLTGSDQDGPEDHRYRVMSGTFHKSEQFSSIGQAGLTDVGPHDVDPAEKEAVLALIEKWEDKLPIMVASPIKPS